MPPKVTLPPLQFNVLFCNASEFDTDKAPLVTVVGPLNVFAAESVSGAEPFWLSAPVPEIIPDRTCAAALL